MTVSEVARVIHSADASVGSSVKFSCLYRPTTVVANILRTFLSFNSDRQRKARLLLGPSNPRTRYRLLRSNFRSWSADRWLDGVARLTQLARNCSTALPSLPLGRSAVRRRRTVGQDAASFDVAALALFTAGGKGDVLAERAVDSQHPCQTVILVASIASHLHRRFCHLFGVPSIELR